MFTSVMILILLLYAVVNVLVYSQGRITKKNQHRRDLPLLLPILSGRDQVLLKGRLLVWDFVVSRLDICLRIH